MKFLANVLKETTTFKSLHSSVKNKNAVAASGVTSVHKANIINTLCTLDKRKALCIAGDEQEAQTLCNDLSSMGKKAYVYPTKDFIFREMVGKSNEYEHYRLNILLKMLNSDYDVIIACIDGASQYTIPKERLKESNLILKPGENISIEKCVKTLSYLGYQRFDQIEGTGQFAVRGGILDFFMPDNSDPIRIEFWGDEIDSINFFDIETQRRNEAIKEISLEPSTEILIDNKANLVKDIKDKANTLIYKYADLAKEILYKEADAIDSGINISNMDKYIPLIYKKPGTLFDYLDDNAYIFISEHTRVKERSKSVDFEFNYTLEEFFEKGILNPGLEKYSLSYNEFLSIIKNNRTVFLDNFTQGSFDIPISNLVNFTVKQTPLWNGSFKSLQEDLESFFNNKAYCVILAGTEKSAKNLVKNLTNKNFPTEYNKKLSKVTKGVIHVVPGGLSGGMEYPEVNFFLISHGLRNYKSVKKAKKIKDGKEISSLSELTVGDYVVHSTHGIGVFKGINKLEIDDIIKDYIKISYAKGDTLYVPVTQLDLVAKYIGPREMSTVKVSRLGGNDWKKAKARVKSSVKDIAKELIVLYAQRMQAKGHAFPKDSEWQHDFEAGFDFEETEDQIRSTEEIKNDMETTAPMDRLLCGDVGFGKTEVALRAAFKCVTDSKQCAFLCPTTILAWQHYQTITRRFEGYPVNIELLSRFRTPKQQKEIIKKLKRGEIDFVIGTHRLVQKDVKYRDLGLVIIDEEQRFGVAQKERFKKLRKNVDILTLSATPIPRTLNMAMTGIRDMSVLEEAPQNRHPVQTFVLAHEPAVINEAIRRELRRGGQVLYLHNRVDSIKSKAAKIAKEIPEAKVGIAHGQMNENELSLVWQKTLEQNINVLVCTTIIETGIDLPNANTFIIENADRMGLSQLHQLRGRVGRSTRRAYAYLTFNPGKVLSDISQKRLTAIREYTEFGSGFKIAMRDLELRGAGSLIGGQQHGHMEDVGYDMYLRLLTDAINKEKGLPEKEPELDCIIDIAVVAHIPENYIKNTSLRLDVYKLIADINSIENSLDVKDELVDRFGKIPKAVLGLIDIALIRNKAAEAGIYEIKQNETSILMYVLNIKSENVNKLMNKLKGKALLNAGNKPYIAIKHTKTTSPLNALKKIFL